MRKSYVCGLLLGGLSLLGCSEEEAGPAVGEDVAWQYACANTAGDCRTSGAAHEAADENTKIIASCKTTSAGLNITIEDPGNYQPEPGLRPRVRSVLTIRNAYVKQERCEVVLAEYGTGGVSDLDWRLVDTCAGNPSNPGTCELTGGPGNGYGFDGTILCTGMKYNAIGMPDFVLQKPGTEQEPVVLQIANCD